MIKLFLVDVDGCLTDGFYNTTETGEISKNFFTRDFHGLWMLSQLGVTVCVVTTATDNVIEHQIRRGAKYVELIKGTRDKLNSVKVKYVDSGMFAWNEIAFMGDDVFDIELMKSVGLLACPSDAADEVLEVVEDSIMIDPDDTRDSFRSNSPGGRGCVREFADHVIRINELWEEIQND